MSTIMNTNNTTSTQNQDELDRQIKQAEMIRQYLHVTNIDTNSIPIKRSSLDSDSSSSITTTNVLPLSSFNFDELRKDLKMAEERVERLRLEIKDLQKNRDESFLKPLPSLPSPYILPPINYLNSDYLNHNHSTSVNLGHLNHSTTPFVQELFSSPQYQQPNQRQISSSYVLPNLNPVNRLSPTPGDISKDHRQRQFLSTMRQHRDQLMVYLDSLKQALNSLDRLASIEPTRSEIHLANMKIDSIQQKTRQLRALKSNRSPQQSPFIECRIRQLEHDLVFMLSEHQKDVQGKLELNEQRSLMLFKIMQVTEELTSVDQQIQQLLSNADIHRINPSPISNEITQQPSVRVIHHPNNLDGRRVSFREPTDNNLLTKLPNVYHHHHH